MAATPSASRQSVATIEMRIRSMGQLFNPLDPSPLHGRALDGSAESYILSWAGEHPAPEPLRLLIHCPESLRVHVVEMADGIHEHFRRTHARGERQFRRRMRIGAISLGAGLVMLAVSVGLRSLLPDVGARALAQGTSEALLILSWVAMWRPAEILLFEHWESHLNHAVLDRLAGIPVECVILPAAVRASTDRPDDGIAAHAATLVATFNEDDGVGNTMKRVVL